jgi:hypothetical protein
MQLAALSGGGKLLNLQSSVQELFGYRLYPLPICGANFYEKATKLAIV